MAPTKVLVVGAIQGQLYKAFQKISKLHAKQNFAFAIAVGDVFAKEETDASKTELKSLLSGSIEVPLPTYFTVGDSVPPEAVRDSIEANGEVCSNLFYLGRKGTLKTSEDIRLVTVGGRLVQNQASLTHGLGNYDPLFLDNDANALRGVNKADILITNQWPDRISLNSATAIPVDVDQSSWSEALARLCSALKPRYHFSSSPTSSLKWEREPFLHPKSYEDSEQSTDVTRFVSLASIDAPSKEWMYAFSIDLSQPPSTTGAQLMSPLTFSPKRKRPGTDNDPDSKSSYSRYDKSSHNNNSHHQGRGRKRARYDPNDCFMCMARPDFNTSMVVSISEESFLTVLKGPLPEPTTFPTLQSSGHSMIIPMYHAASETSLSKRSFSDLQREYTDMTNYRTSLNKMMSSHNLGSVSWEVNRTGIRHMHWQHIACPPSLLKSGLVEAAYKVAAEKASYPKFRSCDPSSLIPDQRSDFFRIWIFQPSATNGTTENNPPKAASPIETADAISNGGHQHDTEDIGGAEKSLYFPIDANLKFNIGFGREVMASLLGLENRVDWRSIPEGGEEGDAEAMKLDFGEFDFAML